MEQLIQTKESSIIYGNFRGLPDQELFRCPRELDDTDIPRYINEHRALVSPMGSMLPFVDDDVEDLHNVYGKYLKDYWRMYFRDGWSGRWMGTACGGRDVEKISELDCIGLNRIISWLCKEFPHGCDWYMDDYFRTHFTAHDKSGKRFLIKPLYSEHYKVMVDTTYGNSDYPVRIYVYDDVLKAGS